MQTKKLQMLLAACTAAVLVAACGGGGDAAGPKTPIARVYVAGDSLADVGARGFKYTVQNSTSASGYPIFPEIVAANFGVTGQCNYYGEPTTNTFTINNAGCTNYAVEGGRIVTANGVKAVPLQLAAMGTNVGTFQSTDLVLVDGGGNDVQDLLSAFVNAGPPANNVAGYQAFLLGQLTPTELGATLPTPTTGPVLAGNLYMQKLADTYYNAIKTNLLDRGATHVAVLNIPDVTLTAGFRLLKAQITAQAGAAAAAQVEAVGRQFAQTFNARLRADVGADSRIALVDFYADLTEEVNNAASFGLTNATEAACIVALGRTTDTGCTDALLDANPPAGMTAGWWRTWAFADTIHPTPYGHQLLAASVNRAIARAGWL